MKCVAVDDEPLALEMIGTFINQTPSLELVEKFDNAIDALQYLQSNSVDLLFLDIQMPDLSGMQLARLLSKGTANPYIVFTTAYSEFALEGYEVDAIDYILKPFDFEDILRAVNRATDRIAKKHMNTQQQQESGDDNIFVKIDSQIVRLKTEEILYIEGFKDYVKIHLSTSTTPLLSLMNLKKMEVLLSNKGFLRIHRSFIISFARVDALLTKHVKIGNKTIPVGTNYRTIYKDFLDKWTT